MRSKYWFKLDLDWVFENFKSRDHDIYKEYFQGHVPGQDDKYQPIFSVIIGNKKIQVKRNCCFILPTWHFNKMAQVVVVLASWVLHLSTLGNILLNN